MIEVVFAILMIQNGKVIEYVPTSGMAECLEQNKSQQKLRSTWVTGKESSRS